MQIERFFTKDSVKVESKIIDCKIQNSAGDVIFEQKGVLAPKEWGTQAVTIAASKYFYGKQGTNEREESVFDLITRVVHTIANWGYKDKYFKSKEEANLFADELEALCINQMYAFNSPVWFNVGIYKKPQCSACFIQSLDDNMESIMNLATSEVMLFKWGSGTGTNVSNLRGSMEKLSGGGTASGPLSFVKAYDAFAGVIKSGGKTRRAAKMVILNADHPDIQSFVNSKKIEEEKVRALIKAGYSDGIDGDAYQTVAFQNANHSVRVTDSFMDHVYNNDKGWTLFSRVDGAPVENISAKDLLTSIAEATWVCGDPGIQFHDTINRWNTVRDLEEINSSNPCTEFMFVDDSACNLGSINLLKFFDEEEGFNFEAFSHAVRLAIIAQDILVSNASYPTDKIKKNSIKYRPLGLGYANLGALLMTLGHPYNSEKGRNTAACITAYMHAKAVETSALLAKELGQYPAYTATKKSFLEVMNLHKEHAAVLDKESGWYNTVVDAWIEAEDVYTKHGARNAQVTLLAPTGTIGFLMGCDTTGIEPDISLIKHKQYSGGGTVRLVNNAIPQALRRLGYTEDETQRIEAYINTHGTAEGSQLIKEEHTPIFDCAIPAKPGGRFIEPNGHLLMMAAVQPFLSGAISKTINVPTTATVNEIVDLYKKAWSLGLKAVAIYRDGSKAAQPLGTTAKEEIKDSPQESMRIILPKTREAKTHRVDIAGQVLFITTGHYLDGTLGEVFLRMSKQGSTISGLVDSLSRTISISLQHGVPAREIAEQLTHMKFSPQGFTDNDDIKIVDSIADYVGRWLLKEIDTDNSKNEEKTQGQYNTAPSLIGEPCRNCGSLTVRQGTCTVCLGCGTTTGCDSA